MELSTSLTCSCILTFIKIHTDFVVEKSTIFFLSSTTVTYNESHSHLNLYQSVKFNSACHHSKFARNWFINVPLQARLNAANLKKLKLVICKSVAFGGRGWGKRHASGEKESGRGGGGEGGMRGTGAVHTHTHTHTYTHSLTHTHTLTH